MTRIDPNNSEFWHHKGIVLKVLGRTTEADAWPLPKQKKSYEGIANRVQPFPHFSEGEFKPSGTGSGLIVGWNLFMPKLFFSHRDFAASRLRVITGTSSLKATEEGD
ncbi:MAG: tetratricopeptide repeat protein [Methanothrix sp.]